MSEEFFDLHHEAQVSGRLRGLIDALRLASAQMQVFSGEPAFDALKDLFAQIEAKFDEVEASRK